MDSRLNRSNIFSCATSTSNDTDFRGRDLLREFGGFALCPVLINAYNKVWPAHFSVKSSIVQLISCLFIYSRLIKLKCFSCVKKRFFGTLCAISVSSTEMSYAIFSSSARLSSVHWTHSDGFSSSASSCISVITLIANKFTTVSSAVRYLFLSLWTPVLTFSLLFPCVAV